MKFDEVTSRTIAMFHIFISPQNIAALPPKSEPGAENLEEELSFIEEPLGDTEENEGILDENTHELKLSDIASFVDSVDIEGERTP